VSQNVTDEQIAGSNSIVGSRGSDILNGTSDDDIITTSAANGRSGRNARDTINIGEITPGSIGNDVITDFDTNNFRGGENNFDTLNFRFDGRDFSLSTGRDIVDFVRYIESDGDRTTDAILDGNDIIFVFNRNDDGGITDSIRLEGILNDDGITQRRLDRASIDRLTDEDVFVAFEDTTPPPPPPPPPPINTAPSVEGPLAVMATEGDNSLTLDLLDGASDVDAGDTLSITNVSALPGGVTLDGTILTLDPSAADFQSLGEGDTQEIIVSYEVTDNNGASVAQTATFTITGANDGPVVGAALSASTTENAAPISLDLITGTSDVDAGDVLSVELVDDLPEGFALEGTVLTLDPNNAIFDALGIGDTLDLTINYNITDGNGASVAQSATFNVEGANDAPIVTGSLDIPAVLVGGEFFFNPETGMPDETEGETVVFDPTTIFTDVDEGDSLTFTVTALDGADLPPWITFDPASGEVTASPEPEDVGLQPIVVTATDSFGASTSQTMFIAAVGAIVDPGRSVIRGQDRFLETVFTTGEGVDTFQSTFESDTFIVTTNGGTDVINTAFVGDDLNTIIFRDVSIDDVEFSIPNAASNANDVTAQFADGSILYLNAFQRSNVNFIFEQDGIILTAEESRQLVLQDHFTDGDDILTGTLASDVLEGGLGDDIIGGGDGADTFIFNVGDGNDTYTEEVDFFSPTQDVVEFSGYNFDDATFSRHPTTDEDLVISFENGDSIILTGALGDDGAGDEDLFEIIRFNDQDITVTDIAANHLDGDVMLSLDNLLPAPAGPQVPTDGNDVLRGTDADETIEGGLGNDFLVGNGGDDTFIFNRGDGADQILDTTLFGMNSNTLDFDNYTSSEAIFTASERDLVITFDGTSDSIFIDNGLSEDSIQTFVFDDGTLDLSDVRDILIAQQQSDGDDIIYDVFGDENIDGGAGDDEIFVADGNSVIDGGDGNDTIRLGAFSEDGIDIVDGGAGNDSISGDSGIDIITGGLDNDFLLGGDGNDTYVFNRGDGNDTIFDIGFFDDESDAIEFNGYNAEDVIFSRDGETLVIGFIDSTDSIRSINNLGDDFDGVERFIFDDMEVALDDFVEDLDFAVF